VVNVGEAPGWLKGGDQAILATIVHHDEEWAALKAFPDARHSDKCHVPTFGTIVYEDARIVAADNANETAEEFVERRAGWPLILPDGVLEILGVSNVNWISGVDHGAADPNAMNLRLGGDVSWLPQCVFYDVFTKRTKDVACCPSSHADQGGDKS
jgi:hypothetical protein